MRLLALFTTFVLLFAGCAKEPPGKGRSDLNEDLRRFNSMTAGIRDITFPQMRYGLTKSSMEYSKTHNRMRFSSSFLGRNEMLAAVDERLFWFWSRSFDPESVYHCRRAFLERTRVRPELYPCIIRGLFCSDPIPEDANHVGNSVSTQDENGMSRLIEMNDGRIVAQEFILDGIPIASMKFIEFQEVEGFNLPKKVTIRWHNENAEITLDMGEAVLNSGCDPSVEMPKGMKRINLEEI